MIELLLELFHACLSLDYLDLLLALKLTQMVFECFPIFAHNLFDFDLFQLSQMADFSFEPLVLALESANLAFSLGFQSLYLKFSQLDSLFELIDLHR